MKVVKKIPKVKDIIPIDNITMSMIVVAKIYGDKCILAKEDSRYNFYILQPNPSEEKGILTSGNGYTLSGNMKSITLFLDEALTVFQENIEIEAFYKKDAAKAFKWLFDA